MADSGDHGADAAKNESEAAASGAGNSLDRNLPMVVAPKLGAGEDDPVDEASAEAAKAAGAAAPSSPHFMLLAASVAFAAAFASFVGSVSGSGLARYINPAAPAPAVDAASQNASDTLRAIKQQLAELAVIKTNLDSASRSTTSQFAKLADRLDRLDQRASADTTGSIGAASAAPALAPQTPAAPEQAKLADRVLPDWVVQDVRSGRALVENRHGALFDVGSGSVLPGLGRVAAIKRQDGQWMVLTESGTITSSGR